jgi:putative transposase
MATSPFQPHRKSIRLAGYNYAEPGTYFVTICVQDRRCCLGEVDGDVVVLSEIGKQVERCWRSLAVKYPQVDLDEFVIMPNHLHGLVVINPVGAGSPRPPTLGQMIGYFKYQSTVQINTTAQTPGRKFWKRNYYEHIVRTDASLNSIREYIHTNPMRWSDDIHNPLGTGTDDVELWISRLLDSKRLLTVPGGRTPPLRTHEVGVGPGQDALQGYIDFVADIETWGI